MSIVGLNITARYRCKVWRACCENRSNISSLPITNFKIVSAIRNEIASRLDIDSFQELLASHWKPYLDNLHKDERPHCGCSGQWLQEQPE